MWRSTQCTKMYKLVIQIHTLLPGGKLPWYSKAQGVNKSHGPWKSRKTFSGSDKPPHSDGPMLLYN